MEWSWTFPGSATAGKYLRAVSSTQDNVAWAFIQADEVRFTPVTGSSLTSTNVADVLEELSEQTFSLSTLSDVMFATGDPQFCALLTYDGAHWTSTDPLSINELLQWNGSAFIGVTALTNVNVTTPAGGDTMSYDFGIASWINRKGYVNIGATSSNVTIGDSNNYATVRFTPSASLQIVNSGLSNDGEKTTLIIVTSGTTSRNITAGSNVVMTGTLATGTVDAVAYVLTFVTDGASGKMYEVSRAGPMS